MYQTTKVYRSWLYRYRQLGLPTDASLYLIGQGAGTNYAVGDGFFGLTTRVNAPYVGGYS